MKKLLTLFFAGMLLSFQAVYSEGQTQPPKPPTPPGGMSSMAQSFAGSAMANMDKNLEGYTLEDEYYLGRAVAANVLSVYKPYTKNEDLTKYLNKICQVLVINSSNPVTFNGYHVLVLDSADFNAFASPGGHIFITRGLVEAAASEDMLAALIAHELAHIILKHGIRLIDEMSIFTDAALAAKQGQAMSGSSAANRLMTYRNSVANLSDAMIKNGYSQVFEFEADREAMKILAASGYDPAALLEVLKVLQRVQGSQRGGFNTTHPSPTDRIVNVETALRNFRVQDTKSFRTGRFKNK